jgi:hypothetical protein
MADRAAVGKVGHAAFTPYDPFILALLALWQFLHWLAGDIAIASPLISFARAA